MRQPNAPPGTPEALRPERTLSAALAAFGQIQSRSVEGASGPAGPRAGSRLQACREGDALAPERNAPHSPASQARHTGREPTQGGSTHGKPAQGERATAQVCAV